MKILIPFLTILDNNLLEELQLLFIALDIDYVFKNNTFFLNKEDLFFASKNINEYLKEVDELLTNKTSENIEKIQISLAYTYFLVLSFYIFFFYVNKNYNYWINIGANDAAKVINGEFYRAITSLTLHKDILHITSNFLFFFILIKPLIEIFNEGKAWFLILLAGFLGNVSADYIYQSFHLSIGFSTSVFSVIGMLAFYNFKQKEKTNIIRKYLPFASAVALLSITGFGKNVDVLAHITGFLSGIVVSIFFEKKRDFFEKYSNSSYQIFNIFILIISWLIAILF